MDPLSRKGRVLFILCLSFAQGLWAQCPDVTFVKPDEFVEFGTDAGDTSLPSDDSDETSTAITLTNKFVYFQEQFDKVFVSANGLVSFGVGVAGQAGTTTLPANSPLIAAFWSDFDLTKNNGEVFYRSSTDASLLEELTSKVGSKFTTPLTFTAKEAVVVTWYRVTHTTGDCDSEVYTFQVVLVTDGRYSFVILNYGALPVWPDDTTPIPLVGINYNMDKNHILPDSETAAIVNLATNTNVEQNGVWMFRVDNPTVSTACDDSGDSLIISPEVASPLGGTKVQISGPCFDNPSDSSKPINVRLGGALGQVLTATYVSRYRVEVIIPAFYYLGTLDLEVAPEGTTYLHRKAVLTLNWDPTVLPVVTRVNPDSWGMAGSASVKITWDQNAITGDNVDVFFSSYASDNGALTELTFPLMEDEPNDGEADIDMNGLALVPDAKLKLVTFGSILIKDAQGGTTGNEVLIYSDLHPAAWFARVLLIELALRNKKMADESNILLPDIWNDIKTSFTSIQTEDMTDDEIKSNLKSAVIDMCPMRKSVLGIIGGKRCDAWRNSQNTLLVPGQVPCTLRQARADPRWTDYTVTPPDVGCSTSGVTKNCVLQTTPTEVGASQKACYGDSGQLIDGANIARAIKAQPSGHVTTDEQGDRTVAKRWMIDHFLEDIEPLTYCCTWSAPAKCSEYTRLRGSSKCTNFTTSSPGGAGGDPHFVTFDDYRYTFNGIGEFLLTNHSGGFEVQARTQQRGTLMASEITSIACKNAESSRIEIRASSTVGLELLIDGTLEVLTGLSPITTQGAELSVTMAGIRVTRLRIAFSTGEVVEVGENDGSLQLAIIPLTSQIGQLYGLLGNYDGDQSNDLQTPGDPITTIDEDSTPQEIHTNAVKWQVSEEDSLFTYVAPETHANIQDPDFEPVYPSDALTAPAFCGGDPFCVYDYNVTGSMEYAMASKALFDELQTLIDDFNSGRTCPQLQLANGSITPLQRRVGQLVSLQCVAGYDLQGSAKRTCQIDLTWDGTNTICTKIADVCEDVTCQNDGTCKEVDGLAVCECKEGYKGSICQTEASDSKVIIIVGAVIGALLLIAIIAVVVLICRTKPSNKTNYGDFKVPPYLGLDHHRDSFPNFRGTNARRGSYYATHDNQGYYPYGEKRYTPPAYSSSDRLDRGGRRDGGRGGDYPLPPSPYPHFGSVHNSDAEDSIDKIYRGDYDPYPQPDYDTEYTSHIDNNRPRGGQQPAFGSISSRGKDQPPPVDNSNWIFKK